MYRRQFIGYYFIKVSFSLGSFTDCYEGNDYGVDGFVDKR
jgi:hypothetical protein